MSHFSNALKTLRKEHQLTQEKLAELLNVSKSSINMYERGEREPNFKTLSKIAKFFNVDMNYLLGPPVGLGLFDIDGYSSVLEMAKSEAKEMSVSVTKFLHLITIFSSLRYGQKIKTSITDMKTLKTHHKLFASLSSLTEKEFRELIDYIDSLDKNKKIDE